MFPVMSERKSSHLFLDMSSKSSWKPTHRCFPLADFLTLGTIHGRKLYLTNETVRGFPTIR